ncbi:MAG TPA: hypothetical protein VM915_05555 [Verrucomicrobiae bacterium]|nr:hypothetical protein [Verrucomicrobiae bacterium]
MTQNSKGARKPPTAAQNYRRRFGPMMAAYVVAVALISGWLGWEPSFEGGAGVALASLPAWPIGGVIWAMGRYLDEEQDEFLRLKQVRSMMLAIGVVMFVCTAWGFISQYADVWPLPLYMVFPMFCGAWGFTSAYVSWRYR